MEARRSTDRRRTSGAYVWPAGRESQRATPRGRGTRRNCASSRLDWGVKCRPDVARDGVRLGCRTMSRAITVKTSRVCARFDGARCGCAPARAPQRAPRPARRPRCAAAADEALPRAARRWHRWGQQRRRGPWRWGRRTWGTPPRWGARREARALVTRRVPGVRRAGAERRDQYPPGRGMHARRTAAHRMWPRTQGGASASR